MKMILSKHLLKIMNQAVVLVNRQLLMETKVKIKSV